MDLKTILDNHKQWLAGTGGARADRRGANLTNANLEGADLRSADLRGANLRGAYLSGANLIGATHSFIILKSISGLAWDIVIKDDLIKVGCQEHSYSKWMSFSHTEIADMDSKALEFYPLLLNILEFQYQGTKFSLTKDLK
jgi:uncharacterized protein YjbI with pentapeptide repeats